MYTFVDPESAAMKTMMRTSTATAATAMTATEVLSISNNGIEFVTQPPVTQPPVTQAEQMALHYRCLADKMDTWLVDSSLADGLYAEDSVPVSPEVLTVLRSLRHYYYRNDA
jgi:hypothetical protein